MKKHLRFKSYSIFVVILFISACVGFDVNINRAPSSESFGDHIQTRFTKLDAVHDFAQPEGGDFQFKFILLDFQAANGANLFLDPKYYQFHDEWFLERTFNGQDFPWMKLPAYANLQIKNPKDLQAALKKMPNLPEGLVRVNDRVVADNFYKASSGPNRVFGLGSVNYSYKPKRALPQIYYFDMVFNDSPTAAEVEKMWTRLSKSLFIADLKWLPRSKEQEALAQTLKANKSWQKRIISYDDLIIPGEISIYSAQNVAGIPIYFAKGEYDPSRLTSDNIVMLDELPDDLPPVRGIITSVPQTELSHVNILARARGSLNVFLSDKKMFEELKKREATKQPVGFWVYRNEFKFSDLTTDDYTKYQKFFAKDSYSLPAIDVSKLEYLYDLKTLSTWKDNQVVRTVGGKSAGMNRLLQVPDLLVPPQTMGLSVRAYREHLNSVFGNDLQSVLSDSRFQKDAKLRYLVLEGPKKFKQLYAKATDQAAYQGLLAGTDASPLGKIVARKGIKEAIESQALDPKLETLVVQELKTRFPKLPKGQAFRFRSSADVEDIPGFVGAGLYDSYSGFIDPATQALDEDDKKKTIARAIKKTWASYWNYRGFEERELSHIDHLSGSMGVMIHPNFPTTVEKANGVLTIRWEKGQQGDRYLININTNKGEAAVVRPDGSVATPHIMSISYVPGVVPYIQENKPSSDGEKVLSDAQAVDLTNKAVKIIDSWVAHINQGLSPEFKNTHYMLDMEFKLIPEKWAVDFSATGADKFILKQARPLMKSQKLSAELTTLPIPRSLLSEATKILRRTLESDQVKFTTIEVYDAKTAYDGAMNVQAEFAWKQPIGKWAAGTTTKFIHPDFEFANHGFMHHGPWDFSFNTTSEAAARTGVTRFEAYESGAMSVDVSSGESFNIGGSSKVQVDYLLQAPEVWLGKLVCRKLFKQPDPNKSPINFGDLKPMKIGMSSPKLEPKININIGIGIGIGIGNGVPDQGDFFSCDSEL